MKFKKNIAFTFVLIIIMMASGLIISNSTTASEEAVTSTGLNWEDAIPITNSNSNNSPLGAFRPSLALSNDGEYIIVAYMKRTGASDGQADPFVQYSTDRGEHWTSIPTPIRVSNDLSKFVAITIDQNNKGHAVWTEKNKELWYGKENNSGTYDVKSIHSIAGGLQDVIQPPKIETFGNNIYTIWSQSENGPTDLYFKRSIDGGANFQSAVKLSNIDGLSMLADMIVDGSGHIHVVYRQQEALTNPARTEDRIYYTVSENAGVSWSTPIHISGSINVSPDPVLFNQPTIYITGNTIHVAFENRVNFADQNVFYVSCTNACKTVENNWSGSKVSIQDYSAKDGDPAYLKPQMVTNGACPFIVFTGIIGNPTTADERIRMGSKCEGWSKNPTISSVDNVMGTNIRGINPSADTTNGWYIHFAFERKEGALSNDPGHIYVTRNIPAVYLPTILK